MEEKRNNKKEMLIEKPESDKRNQNIFIFPNVLA